MSIAAAGPAAAERIPALDWPFLLAAVFAAALLVGLVLIDGQPSAAALIVFGFALGAVFLRTEFSFTAAWRRFIMRGHGDGLLGGLLLIADLLPVHNYVPHLMRPFAWLGLQWSSRYRIYPLPYLRSLAREIDAEMTVTQRANHTRINVSLRKRP